MGGKPRGVVGIPSPKGALGMGGVGLADANQFRLKNLLAAIHRSLAQGVRGKFRTVGGRGDRRCILTLLHGHGALNQAGHFLIDALGVVSGLSTQTLFFIQGFDAAVFIGLKII